jgi:hypothetical protein
MQNATLIKLTGRDQIKAAAAHLDEIVNSGASVIFSFSLSDRGMVLITTSSSESGNRQKRCLKDRDIDENAITETDKEGKPDVVRESE